MKNHSRNLHAPFCGIFCLLSVDVARYAALNQTKSPTNCDIHLAESLFQTRSSEYRQRVEIFMKINKKKIAILCMILLSVLTSGCGKEKTVDEASSQVIQISVAPVEATPTPAPDQVASAAVITNGNLTMVNNYLADQSTTDASTSEISDSGNNTNTDTSTDGGTDASTDSNTEDNSAADSEE